MAKAKRTRKRYSAARRAKILAAAEREGLSGAAVQKRFGVTAVTFYSWRKKTGKDKPRGKSGSAGHTVVDGLVSTKLRKALQARIRVLLPSLIDAEVDRYVDASFGARRRRRR
jgi:transposase-like protein